MKRLHVSPLITVATVIEDEVNLFQEISQRELLVLGFDMALVCAVETPTVATVPS